MGQNFRSFTSLGPSEGCWRPNRAVVTPIGQQNQQSVLDENTGKIPNLILPKKKETSFLDAVFSTHTSKTQFTDLYSDFQAKWQVHYEESGFWTSWFYKSCCSFRNLLLYADFFKNAVVRPIVS